MFWIYCTCNSSIPIFILLFFLLYLEILFVVRYRTVIWVFIWYVLVTNQWFFSLLSKMSWIWLSSISMMIALLNRRRRRRNIIELLSKLGAVSILIQKWFDWGFRAWCNDVVRQRLIFSKFKIFNILKSHWGIALMSCRRGSIMFISIFWMIFSTLNLKAWVRLDRW